MPEKKLPPGWTAHHDPTHDTTYYWHESSGMTSWEMPTPGTAPVPAETSANDFFAKRKAALAEDEGPNRSYKSRDGGATSRSKWEKREDPETGVPFFYNTATMATQWEVPDEPFEDTTIESSTPSSAGAQSNEYAQKASFGKYDGSFGNAGGGGYFDQKGIPSDREGRMMSNFFDLSTLEANRQEYEDKKKTLKKKYDWKKYGQMKKKEKIRRRVQELLKD